MMNKFDLDVLANYVRDTTICCEKHPSEDIFIYGYYSDHHSKTPTIWDDISIHCRGLILDSGGEVIEKPFPKFWTYRQYLSQDTVLLSEGKIAEIPKGKFRILEKLDGTMVTLYWVNDMPYLATQRSFSNVKTIEATKLLHEKYSHLFSKLNKNYTYVFEAIYPETKVLIDYGDKRDLFLIGVVNKKTGELMPLSNIGFPMCHDYTKEYAHITNFDDLVNLNLPNKEGFVLYFENGFMMKLKFPWYQEAHRLLDYFIHKDKISYIKYQELGNIFNSGNGLKKLTNLNIWEALKIGDRNLFSIKQSVPDFYYLMGLDYWLESNRQEIIDQLEERSHTIKDKSKLWDEVRPTEIKIYDIAERMKNPHIHETIVWKWEQRYLKK